MVRLIERRREDSVHRFSRRTAMRACALLAATFATARASARGAHYTPALVIGTGYGGAVAALRLAEAGIPTLVLERGKRWPIRADGNTFATFEQPDGRAAWLSDVTPAHLVERAFGIPPKPVERHAGVFEHIAADGIDVVAGAGVGGGSLVNNGITVEPRREEFERAFGGLVDYDDMHERFYPRARAILKPERIPDDLLALPLYQSTRVQEERARAAGLTVRPVELALDFEVVREELAGKRRPSVIAGQSWYGLNSGAKRSLDRSYLRQAEATRMVEVLPLHEVTEIRELGRLGLFLVSARELDERGTTRAQHRFVCHQLFLAAGSMGTSKLLVRARDTGALPRLNAAVGKHWGGNGDVVVVRAGEQPLNPGQGGIAGHFIAEDLADPAQPTSIAEVTTPSHLVLAPGVASFIAMGVEPALGELRYDRASDGVQLRVPPRSDPRYAAAELAMSRTLAKLDAASATQTLMRNSQLTAHPLGGAAMGAACDSYGRVKGYRNLYVLDGALIPGSTGLVNPSFTIAALAERSMAHILAHDC
jgi:cholesterol oxidase